MSTEVGQVPGAGGAAAASATSSAAGQDSQAMAQEFTSICESIMSETSMGINQVGQQLVTDAQNTDDDS